MTIEAWLGNSFWHMLHNFWWLCTLFGLGGAELFIKASCSSVCSVCMWRTHSCGVEYMLPHRSHFRGGKSLLSSFTSSWNRHVSQNFCDIIISMRIISRLRKSKYLSFLSSIFSHVSVREFYMSHPVWRSVKRLTTHIARQWCIFLFFHISVFVRAMHNLLRRE